MLRACFDMRFNRFHVFGRTRLSLTYLKTKAIITLYEIQALAATATDESRSKRTALNIERRWH